MLSPRAGCLLFLALLTGCASAPQGGGADYRLIWTATRTADHAPLAASSALIRLGGTGSIRTGEPPPTEERPSVDAFMAHLTSGKKPGTVQVVTRAALHELTRPPKSRKLHKHKRYIGALLPMRPGEIQTLNSAGDSVTVTVQLKRAAGR